jgi:hypothetical protein
MPYSLTVTGPGVQPAMEGRRDLKVAVFGREVSHRAFNRNETQNAARVTRGIGGKRPGNDDIVADVDVHLRYGR